MLIGFGCTVPAVMATRTLPSERDRRMTILLTPFMSCTAKLHRLPSPRNVLQLLWEKAKDFLHRAFTIILVATIVIWFLQTFDLRLNVVTDSQNSILAAVAGLLAPLFRPLGLGDWRICTSLISGFLAKESVVSTMEILFAGDVTSLLTPLAAATMLVFSLLYTPCVAAIAAVRRELGGRWALCVVLEQCAIAWVAAGVVHLVGLLLGMA